MRRFAKGGLLLAGFLAAASVGGIASAPAAKAQGWGYYHGGWGHPGWGGGWGRPGWGGGPYYHHSHGWGPGAVVGGVIGGVALGALAAGALNPGYGPPPPPVIYAPPPPVVYAPPPPPPPPVVYGPPPGAYYYPGY